MTDPFLPAARRQLGADCDRVLELAAEHHAWAVGGWVRDVLAGLGSDDLDFATPRPDRLVDALRPLTRKAVLLDAERRVWRVVLRRGFIDVARWKGPTLREDLLARDLRVNAMAWSPAKGVLDPLDGRSDLASGTLRLASPQALLEDPLRALRWWRIALKLDATPAPDELPAMNGLSLAPVAPERVVGELSDLLLRSRARQALLDLQARGVLTQVLPRADPDALLPLPDDPSLERPWAQARRESCEAAIPLGNLLTPEDALAVLPVRRWPARFAPAAAAVARERLLPSPADTSAQRADALLRWSCRAPYALLGRALAGRGDAQAFLAQLDDTPGFRNPKNLPVPPLPRTLLSGRQLARLLAMKPGPTLGPEVDALRAAQLAGAVTTEEQAVAWAQARATARAS